MNNSDRSYQRALVAAIESEMGPRRWTRTYLAQKAGITPQTMDRIFWMQRDMNVSQFAAIADALEVSVDHLVAVARQWSKRIHPDTEAIIAGSDILTEDQKQAIRSQITPDSHRSGSAATDSTGLGSAELHRRDRHSG